VLPKLVMQFEQFKAGAASEVPDLPFMLLSALPLSQNDWVSIAKNASWQTTRMNLSTFARHGVFEAPGLASLIAARLRDAGEIERSRVFPFQLLTAYRNCDAAVPEEVRDALQDAIELAIANVPSVAGQVVVCPDISGSMRSPVTGHRRGSTSTVQCVDIAALASGRVGVAEESGGDCTAV